MQNNSSILRWIIAGGVLFSLLFFQEKLGVNIVLFDLFILAAIFILYAEARQSAAVKWLALGHLTCLAMLVLHNTDLSKLAVGITLIITVAYGLYLHRSPLFAGASGIANLVVSPYLFVRELVAPRTASTKKKKRWTTVIRFAILPLFLLAFFYGIYAIGNSALNEFTAGLMQKLQLAIQQFFPAISWERLLLLVFGVIVTSALLVKRKSDYFSKKDLSYEDNLKRKRESWASKSHHPMYNLIQTFMGKLATGMMALKNENSTGLISLGLLNLLLLVVNLIDLNFLWLSYDATKERLLYKMLHEGTGMLIFSIVMAMLVLLFFFKGNLNFYKKNKWLKFGAYCWIIQNTMLVGSVFLRDFYYIQRYGLAYKRIGVLFFLLMVLIGLFTMVLKIRRQRTVYYLLRVNAAAAIVVLVLASAIHWDELIAGYNLSRKEKVPLDVPFLLSLSDKTIPLLEKNIAYLEQYQNKAPDKIIRDFYAAGSCNVCYVDQLKDKEKQFLNKQATYSWLSWNYSDNYVKRYLAYLSTSH